MRDHIIWRAVGDNLGFLRRRIVREGVGLAFAVAGRNELRWVQIGDLPFNDAAVIGDWGEGAGHVGAIDGELGVAPAMAICKLHDNVLAPTEIDEFGGFRVDDLSGFLFSARSWVSGLTTTGVAASIPTSATTSRAAGRTRVLIVVTVFCAVARNRSTFARCNACIACGDATAAFTGGDFGVLYVDMDVVRVGLDFFYFTCAVDGDVIGADGDGFYAGVLFNSDGGRFCDGEAVELAAA